MYIVLAKHNTGHGKNVDIVLCTNDFDKALSTVNNIDQLDYEFYSDSCYVAILNIKAEKIYLKREYKYLIGSKPDDHPVILFKKWDGNGWIEEVD